MLHDSTPAPRPVPPETAPDPAPNATSPDADAPAAPLRSLDTLWFQVAGTLCNLACTHCFISCSPTNRTHEHLSLARVEEALREARELGVKEYYFTGGEPFLNPEMEQILAAALAQGPATVLTNGLLLDAARCDRLAALAAQAWYSLDVRISLDGWSAQSNDPIRGVGTFARIVEAIARLHRAGINPVITVTEVHAETRTDAGKERFLGLLRELGIHKPRLKVLPVFQLGAEVERTGGAYASWQRLRASDAVDEGWQHLQCSGCRMVTDQGVWVCPILVNEPSARMGATLADSLGPFSLRHAACWTCHVDGVSCRT
jgi:molybdenum cofactor biosynthesis enzyme MoaA